ncbi:hypothetical protein ABZV31_05695 [Streptomyces sp. NPDC005202]|uniref:hypothetical protein n=1 Tax=Streptomyces sp. NPDC005202 TaxID=3157021 RepID=UPI0033B6D190
MRPGPGGALLQAREEAVAGGDVRRRTTPASHMVDEPFMHWAQTGTRRPID